MSLPDPSPFDRLIALLAPLLRDDDARRALLSQAFNDMPRLLDQIDFDGAADRFTTRLLSNLRESNRAALSRLRDTAKSRLGIEEAAALDAAFDAWLTPIPLNPTPPRTPDLPDVPFVFISYSRRDSAFVERLVADLAARGITCWVDTTNLTPGTPDWERAIRAAIRDALAVILIASPNSRESPFVRDELALADAANRKIIPVWAAGTLWIDSLPLGRGSLQGIDMRAANYTSAKVDALVRAIEGRGAPLPPTPGLHQPISTPAQAAEVEQSRRLDAAMPAQAQIDQPTEVHVKICLPNSDGLRAELPVVVRSGDVIQKDDTRTSSFMLTFPSADGKLRNAAVCVEVTSSQFIIEMDAAQRGDCESRGASLSVPPDADSRTLIVTLTPRQGARSGTTGRVYVRVFQGERIAGEVALNTELVETVARVQYELASALIGAMSTTLPPSFAVGGRDAAPAAPADAPSAGDAPDADGLLRLPDMMLPTPTPAAPARDAESAFQGAKSAPPSPEPAEPIRSGGEPGMSGAGAAPPPPPARQRQPERKAAAPQSMFGADERTRSLPPAPPVQPMARLDAPSERSSPMRIVMLVVIVIAALVIIALVLNALLNPPLDTSATATAHALATEAVRDATATMSAGQTATADVLTPNPTLDDPPLSVIQTQTAFVPNATATAYADQTQTALAVTTPAPELQTATAAINRVTAEAAQTQNALATPAPPGTTLTITLYRDTDSLTIYLPASSPSPSLQGLRLRVSQGVYYELDRFAAFAGLPFDNLPTPICFRLIRSGSASPLPLACPTQATFTQQVADSDVFWYDSARSSALPITVERGSIFYICPTISACNVILSSDSGDSSGSNGGSDGGSGGSDDD